MDNRRPGDWDCPQCNQMNFASRVKCFKCGVPKQDGGAPVIPVPGGQPYPYVIQQNQYPQYNQKQGNYGYNQYKNKNIKEGDWFCACGAHNYAFRTDCFRCKNAKQEGQVQAPQIQQYGGQAHVKPGDWYCPSEGCGFHNFANRDKCFKCGTQKVVAGGFQPM